MSLLGQLIDTPTNSTGVRPSLKSYYRASRDFRGLLGSKKVQGTSGWFCPHFVTHTYRTCLLILGLTRTSTFHILPESKEFPAFCCGFQSRCRRIMLDGRSSGYGEPASPGWKEKGHWTHKLATITPLYYVTRFHQMRIFVISSQAHSSLLANLLDILLRVIKNSIFLITMFKGWKFPLFPLYHMEQIQVNNVSWSRGRFKQSSDLRSKNKGEK